MDKILKREKVAAILARTYLQFAINCILHKRKGLRLLKQMGDAAAFWGHPFLRNLILQILLLHPSSLFLRLYTQAGITIDTIWLRKDWTHTFIFSFFRIIKERMGKTLNIVWSLLTALVTLSTTGLMGVAVLTNHWEYITYSQSSVEALIYENNSSTSSSSSSISVKQIMDDRVIVVTTEDQNELLVRMHAGLWATCYDLTGKRRNMNLEIHTS